MPSQRTTPPSIVAVSERRTLEELRVAQAELLSSKDKVFVRLSEGAVAFRTDRKQAESQVAAMIREEILLDAREEADGKKKR
jgi:hypothetical protein